MTKSKEIFLMSIFEQGLSESEILSYISAFDFNDDLIIKAYKFSIEKEYFSVSEALLKMPAIKREFSFFDAGTLDRFVATKKFPQISPLYFKRLTPSFESVLEEIFRTSKISSYKKRMGRAAQEHGTIVLNNAWIFNSLFPLPPILDQFLAYPHKFHLAKSLITLCDTEQIFLKKLLPQSSINKTIKSLLSYNDKEFIDICLMNIDLSKFKTQSEIFNSYLEHLPELNSFKDIHDYFVLETQRIDPKSRYNIDLNQSIVFLDNLPLLDFKISVPKTGIDLFETGLKMKNCVGSYMDSVIDGESLVLNLLDKSEIVYTLELKKTASGYSITQFKGTHNDSTMEGPEGYKYRKTLIDLLKDNSK